MELPASTSYDANLQHLFRFSLRATLVSIHGNEKWFAGFSQTTYPPLTHQWIALLSHIVGLTEAFMLVQLAAIVLLVVGTWRFARLCDDRAASLAAVLSIFAGTVAFPGVLCGPIADDAVCAPLSSGAFLLLRVSRADAGVPVEGVVPDSGAGLRHHVTLIFGSVLFAAPVLWLAYSDAASRGSSTAAVWFARAFTFVVLTCAGVGVVLLPYWIAILRHPIEPMPIHTAAG